MMETKYTPGPWCIHPEYDDMVSTSDGTADICVVDAPHPDYEEEWAANRRLIAAAPDLHKAASEALGVLETAIEFEQQFTDGAEFDHPWLGRARAAIASIQKALATVEGGQ